MFDEGAQNFKQINLSILVLSGLVAGVVLLVETCEQSEVSELSHNERSGVAQKRLRFVFLEFF